MSKSPRARNVRARHATAYAPWTEDWYSLLCAYQPEHETIQAACSRNRDAFVDLVSGLGPIRQQSPALFDVALFVWALDDLGVNFAHDATVNQHLTQHGITRIEALIQDKLTSRGLRAEPLRQIEIARRVTHIHTYR